MAYKQKTGTWTDSDRLQGIFHAIYDIDSMGVRPQMALMKRLTSGKHIRYEKGSARFTLSGALRSDTFSNMFDTPSMVRTFDPSAYGNAEHLFPANYFAEDAGRLRTLKAEMERLSATGRYATLVAVSGCDSGDLEEIAEALTAKGASRGARIMADQCRQFLSDHGDLPGFENELYDYWNTDGRGERTLFHAAKLDLMNGITDTAIRKAQSVGLDPDAFTRNDPYHAEYWEKTFGEGVPTPGVLLERSRDVVAAARKKYEG
ncbi:MAG: hypothetical protein HYS53_00815 [Candidatus Aenigmarchaeota archaeon]|nr:hypothetical protein [Candidatus Aenigmarchaeota archaeon]